MRSVVAQINPQAECECDLWSGGGAVRSRQCLIHGETCAYDDQPISEYDPDSGLCQEHLDDQSHDIESQRYARVTRALADDDTGGGRWVQ
ncbi:MAG: hypothetical protein ACRCYU_08505 [Nocardioides sp.]